MCGIGGIVYWDGREPPADQVRGLVAAHLARFKQYPSDARNSGKTGTAAKPEQIKLAEALDALKPLLADPAVLKVGHDIKDDLSVFARHDVEQRREGRRIALIDRRVVPRPDQEKGETGDGERDDEQRAERFARR